LDGFFCFTNRPPGSVGAGGGGGGEAGAASIYLPAHFKT
jgi:hypothetical protein